MVKANSGNKVLFLEMEAAFGRRLAAADRRLSFMRTASAELVRSAKWLKEHYPGARLACMKYKLTISNLREQIDVAALDLTREIKRCQGWMLPEKPTAGREKLAKQAKEAHWRKKR